MPIVFLLFLLLDYFSWLRHDPLPIPTAAVEG